MQMKQSGYSANLPNAMIFKSHCERHHGLQFQVRVSLQPCVLNSQAQRQRGYWVARAVHLGNQMQTAGATHTLAFRIWAEIEARRHRLLSLLPFAFKMRKVT